MRILLLILFCLPMTLAYADVTNGLVGWWKFDEASGNAIDSGSGANDGTPTGTTITPGCKKNGCRSFNGSTDFVDIGSGHYNFLKTTPFSGTAWIKTSTSGRMVIADWSVTATPGWVFSVGEFASGRTTFFMTNSFGTGYFGRDGATSVIDNAWHHIAFTYSGSATPSGVNIYVDGVLQTMADRTTGTADPGTLVDSGLRIGAREYSGINAPFNGLIDDARLYNRELTASEVAEIYNSGMSRITVKGRARLTGLKIK